jgi:hypothetical protein
MLGNGIYVSASIRVTDGFNELFHVLKGYRMWRDVTPISLSLD